MATGQRLGHLAVLMADGRERAAAAELDARGVATRTWPAADDAALDHVLRDALAVLGPVRMPAAVLPALELLPPGTPVIVGVADPALRVATRRCQLLTYADDEAFATRNAVPTAEGAVMEASRLAGATAHGARAAVLGFGRCGQALAERLIAWHADVVVAARRPEQLALAAAHGARAVPWSRRTGAIADCRFIFNTVPAPALGARELAEVDRQAWVIDLASAPGGVDLAAAGQLGVQARLLPGLPGRIFPETAGRLVAETVYPWLPPSLRQSEV